MIGSEKLGIFSDDSALVNSNTMDLHHISVHNCFDSSLDHLKDVVFYLNKESKETEHTLMLNANHVIKAAEAIADHAGLCTSERDQIKTALRLLKRRTRQEAKRYARKTN